MNAGLLRLQGDKIGCHNSLDIQSEAGTVHANEHGHLLGKSQIHKCTVIGQKMAKLKKTLDLQKCVQKRKTLPTFSVFCTYLDNVFG